MGENGNFWKKCLLLVVNGVNSGRRSSGVQEFRKKEKKKKEEEGGRRKKKEEEGGNFFLCFSCFSYLVNGHILYLSMHLHVLANVVMLNLLS
jgi:nicotinamide riboside kinase